MSEKDFYTAQELADKLDYNVMTIYRYIQSGKLKAYKTGKDFRIDKKEFNRFLDEMIDIKKIPTVKGFVFNNKFYFYCQKCNEFHNHGTPDQGTGKNKTKHGHRISQCSHYPNGYNLEEFTKTDLLRIKEWIDYNLKKYKN